MALRRMGFWYTLTWLSSPQHFDSSSGGEVDRENGEACLGDWTVANLVMPCRASSNDVNDELSSSDIDRVVGGDRDGILRGDMLDRREYSEGWYGLGRGDGDRTEGGVGVIGDIRTPALSYGSAMA